MKKIALLNASPNSGNMGVSALCISAVYGLQNTGSHQIQIAHNGRDFEKVSWTLKGRKINADLIPLSPIRRYWRGDCLKTVHFLSSFGGIGSRTAKELVNSSVILDVSGGDSFTDLYGQRRFQAMIETKEIALKKNIPLILLPQTIGPFKNPDNKERADNILRRAAAIFVRDVRSFEYIQEVLGDAFNPGRHKLALDMALGMPSSDMLISPQKRVAEWLSDQNRDFPVFGLNTSGLLVSAGKAAKDSYGLQDPHLCQLEAIARRALQYEPKSRLLLVPHVVRPSGHPESDWDAAMDLKKRLLDFGDRVEVLPQFYSAPELKWIISRLDWFAGARMHSTIAGISSGVPTMGLAYSDKAYGVFERCRIGSSVADLRTLDTEQLADMTEQSLAIRGCTRAVLEEGCITIHAAIEQQFRDLASIIEEVSV